MAASTDLGPARPQQIQLTAALTDQQRPSELIDWTHDHGLSVSWRPSDNWAIVEGTPDAIARAFDVTVHDYRGRQGQQFYASPQQPVVPEALRDEVAELGRILATRRTTCPARRSRWTSRIAD